MQALASVYGDVGWFDGALVDVILTAAVRSVASDERWAAGPEAALTLRRAAQTLDDGGHLWWAQQVHAFAPGLLGACEHRLDDGVICGGRDASSPIHQVAGTGS